MHIYQMFGLVRYSAGMAKYDDIVERPKGNSWRTSANAPEGLRKQLYQQMLRDELGRDPDFRQAEVKEPSMLASPIVIGILAFLTFVLVLAGLLWRDGVFDDAFTWAKTSEPSRAWMLGDKSRPTEEAVNLIAPDSFVEPVVTEPDDAASEPPAS